MIYSNATYAIFSLPCFITRYDTTQHHFFTLPPTSKVCLQRLVKPKEVTFDAVGRLVFKPSGESQLERHELIIDTWFHILWWIFVTIIIIMFIRLIIYQFSLRLITAFLDFLFYSANFKGSLDSTKKGLELAFEFTFLKLMESIHVFHLF